MLHFYMSLHKVLLRRRTSDQASDALTLQKMPWLQVTLLQKLLNLCCASSCALTCLPRWSWCQNRIVVETKINKIMQNCRIIIYVQKKVDRTCYYFKCNIYKEVKHFILITFLRLIRFYREIDLLFSSYYFWEDFFFVFQF